MQGYDGLISHGFVELLRHHQFLLFVIFIVLAVEIKRKAACRVFGKPLLYIKKYNMALPHTEESVFAPPKPY
jgi:hypothetical protein